MLNAWRPADTDEYAIFLEDDIAISPVLLLYADASIRGWFYDASDPEPPDSRIAGFSCYNQLINEVRVSCMCVVLCVRVWSTHRTTALTTIWHSPVFELSLGGLPDLITPLQITCLDLYLPFFFEQKGNLKGFMISPLA